MSHEQAPKVEVEHKPLSHEAHARSHELEKARHEKAEHAKDRVERELTEARMATQQEAISGDEMHKPQSESRQPQTIRTRADRDHSFNTTMHHVRKQLSGPEKALSRVVHNPTVEKVSEVAGATIARPSGATGAAVAAVIGLLSIYGVAKFVGFELSGSEMPLLLAFGFVAGLLLEWIYKAIRALAFPSKT